MMYDFLCLRWNLGGLYFYISGISFWIWKFIPGVDDLILLMVAYLTNSGWWSKKFWSFWLMILLFSHHKFSYTYYEKTGEKEPNRCSNQDTRWALILKSLMCHILLSVCSSFTSICGDLLCWEILREVNLFTKYKSISNLFYLQLPA
jgi:hypothetical protein